MRDELSSEDPVVEVLFRIFGEEWLLDLVARGTGASTAVSAVVDAFPFKPRTAWQLWKDRASVSTLLRPPRISKPLKPTQPTKEEVAAMIAGVPLVERQTLRSLPVACGIPPASLWRYLKKNWLRRAGSRVKPTLTDAHNFDVCCVA
ncbi:hypothetical protein PF003_g3301 [Phytophthora fragariae]|nr:hypothetical protein PF003_g3301 [Phytophthora fragariae]